MQSLKEEFVVLIEQHKGIITRVCNMYCIHTQDREDLFQDITLQLWQSYPSFSGASKVSTWIYRIALNVSITRLRKKSKAKPFDELDDEALNLPEDAACDEKTKIMYAAIQKLTDVEKAIIMLYMDNYSYREIAELVGITESNVGFKLNRIRNKLKNMVNNS